MDAVGSAMKFLSTPSARRATGEPPQLRCHGVISIHALREEGDCISLLGELLLGKFLSTPSARRATRRRHHYRQARRISIHALREEGDKLVEQRPRRHYISIHALREEGDGGAGLLRLNGIISIHALREEGDLPVPWFSIMPA